MLYSQRTIISEDKKLTLLVANDNFERYIYEKSNVIYNIIFDKTVGYRGRLFLEDPFTNERHNGGIDGFDGMHCMLFMREMMMYYKIQRDNYCKLQLIKEFICDDIFIQLKIIIWNSSKKPHVSSYVG